MEEYKIARWPGGLITFIPAAIVLLIAGLGTGACIGGGYATWFTYPVNCMSILIASLVIGCIALLGGFLGLYEKRLGGYLALFAGISSVILGLLWHFQVIDFVLSTFVWLGNLTNPAQFADWRLFGISIEGLFFLAGGLIIYLMGADQPKQDLEEKVAELQRRADKALKLGKLDKARTFYIRMSRYSAKHPLNDLERSSLYAQRVSEIEQQIMEQKQEKRRQKTEQKILKLRIRANELLKLGENSEAAQVVLKMSKLYGQKLFNSERAAHYTELASRVEAGQIEIID